ncbi:hypothetical protein TRVA0_032S01662 [Trichomonascus vanleenenianus]|uniref:uncharacterized protein n=1 Tax=Trichomonascus vanleenenianus TaxID=2268995 RepID=UPI003EC9622C
MDDTTAQLLYQHSSGMQNIETRLFDLKSIQHPRTLLVLPNAFLNTFRGPWGAFVSPPFKAEPHPSDLRVRRFFPLLVEYSALFQAICILRSPAYIPVFTLLATVRGHSIFSPVMRESRPPFCALLVLCYKYRDLNLSGLGDVCSFGGRNKRRDEQRARNAL